MLHIGVAVGVGFGLSAGGGASLGASDDFNRANSTTGLGTSSSGHLWTDDLGTGGIDANRAYAEVGTWIATVNAGLADGNFSVTVAAGTASAGSDFPGVTYRGTGGSDALLGVFDTTTAYIVKREAGSNTTLASGAHGGFADGDVIRVIPSGNNHSLRKGNTEVVTTTSSFNASATKVGLHSIGGTARFEDFLATP